jgi:2'-5' RNA ligase
MCAEKVRLFTAVDIPHEMKEVVSDAVNNIRPVLEGARWVKPQNLHLTIKFIGNFDVDSLEKLKGEISAVTDRCPKFMASLRGCGAFPSRKKARVLWIGMSDGRDEMDIIARKIDKRLERLGIDREERPFRGHLTIARLKKPMDCSNELDRLMDMLSSHSELAFPVEEIVLFQSKLSRHGPDYTPLHCFCLGGG